MSTIKLLLTLKQELKKVNRKIDLRIMMGLPYKREAEYHKRLTWEMRRLARRNWFGRYLRMFSFV